MAVALALGLTYEEADRIVTQGWAPVMALHPEVAARLEAGLSRAGWAARRWLVRGITLTHSGFLSHGRARLEAHGEVGPYDPEAVDAQAMGLREAYEERVLRQMRSQEEDVLRHFRTSLEVHHWVHLYGQGGHPLEIRPAGRVVGGRGIAAGVEHRPPLARLARYPGEGHVWHYEGRAEP